jgi:hypothetical protein
MILNRSFTAQTSDWSVRNCVWGWPESCFETGNPLEGSDFGSQCSHPLLYCKSLDTLGWLLVGSGGMRWHSRLRHCAARWKDGGSILDGVFGIFHWHKHSRCTMVLGLTQPLTEMSSRNISCGGKGGRCVGLTTLLPTCADCLEIREPQPPGTFTGCPAACSGVALPLRLLSWFLPYPVQSVLHNHHLI